MIGIFISIWSLPSVGSSGPPPVNFFYRRPDTISRFLRPDGTSFYLRP